MSVIGFDLGNLSCYTACARGGGIETLANEYSSRNTPSFVSFSGNQRLMGTAAQQAQVTNMKNTIFNLKRFVGRTFSDPRVQFEKQHFSPFNILEGPGDSILIQASYMGETSTFTPEQIVAMLFTKLKDAGEVALEKKITDCVISVPAYFTDHQRRRLLDASAMSNLNCLKLMNETTAVALSYGIYKQDLPSPEERPRNVVFVDFGHSSLQASVVAFHKGKLKMLAFGCDPDIGGRNFDLRLAEHFNEGFKKKYKIDAKTNPRAMIRLMSESEKIKKLMSANSTELPINIECFMEDKDVLARIKREEFENICGDLFQRVHRTLEDLLNRCDIHAKDIHSVEVVGGGTRIPAVKKIIKEIFGHDTSTTLNADEAVARGCALQCAILSPTFRVRDFKIDDCQNFPINLIYQTADNEEQEMEVFPQWSQVPMSRMLTFYRKEPFGLQAVYGKPSGGLPYPSTKIGHFVIRDVVPTTEGEASKVKVKIRVDVHGILKISQAQMVEKLEKGDDDEKTDDSSSKMETDESSTTDSVPKPADSAESTGGNDVPMTDATKQNGEGVPADSTDPPVKETKEDKKKPKVRTVTLTVESHVTALSPKQLNHYVEMENEMIMQDKREKERQDAKNGLEEYVYDMRSKCNEEYARFVQENEREKFVQVLDATEEWLYDEGENQNKSVYVTKLADLKKIGQPIVDRCMEFERRPKALDDLAKSIGKIFIFVDLHGKGEEKYAHVTADEAAKAGAAAIEAQAWMDDAIAKQAKLPLHASPAVMTSAILDQRKKLISTTDPILNKPLPKPAKDQPPPDNKDAADSSDKTANNENANENQNNSAGVNGPSSTDAAPDATDQAPASNMDLD